MKDAPECTNIFGGIPQDTSLLRRRGYDAAKRNTKYPILRPFDKLRVVSMVEPQAQDKYLALNIQTSRKSHGDGNNRDLDPP